MKQHSNRQQIYDESSAYALRYVWSATANDDIPPPEPSKAGSAHIGILTQLYEINKSHGAQWASRSWENLRHNYPALNKQKHLHNFRNLQGWKAPAYALPVATDGNAPEWAIYLKGLNLMYGEPGTGKTFAALDFACRMCLAYPDSAVIYSSGEGNAGMYGRLRGWETKHKINIGNLFLYDKALEFGEAEEVSAFFTEAAQLNPIFVIVDTLARSTMSLNENDKVAMQGFITETERIVQAMDIGVLFLHHTNKVGGMRGSTAINGAMDSIIKLQRADTTITAYNGLERGGKNKHREEVAPQHFEIQKIHASVDGTPTDQGVLTMQSNAPKNSATFDLTKNQNAVLEVMDAHGKVSPKLIEDATQFHRATMYRILKELLGAGLVYHNTETGLYSMTDAGRDKYFNLS